jgi:hypothetical protein
MRLEIIIIMLSPVTALFSLLLLLLNQPTIPTAQPPVSDCSTLRIVRDVASTAVVCSEYIECFPGMASEHFFKTYVAVPVASLITGILHISHFTFGAWSSIVVKVLRY